MNRRVRVSMAVVCALVLCVGTYEVASADARRPFVSTTQALGACSTGRGYLRLARHGGCPSGTSKVHLARPATTPKALAIDIASRGQSAHVYLHGGAKLEASCTTKSVNNGGVEAYFDVFNYPGRIQVDGTSFVARNGDTGADFQYSGGKHAAVLQPGADSVYASRGVRYHLVAGQDTSSNPDNYAILNLHLLITVSGAEFTVDAVVATNGSPRCRISAMVETAST